MNEQTEKVTTKIVVIITAATTTTATTSEWSTSHMAFHTFNLYGSPERMRQYRKNQNRLNSLRLHVEDEHGFLKL